MDGARKALAYLLPNKCDYTAVVLRQLEEGSPWPTSTRHARVVYLGNLGAANGEVMSYRPLTITSPLYERGPPCDFAPLKIG